MPALLTEQPLELFTVRRRQSDQVMYVSLRREDALIYSGAFGHRKVYVTAQLITLGEPRPIAFPRKRVAEWNAYERDILAQVEADARADGRSLRIDGPHGTERRTVKGGDA